MITATEKISQFPLWILLLPLIGSFINGLVLPHFAGGFNKVKATTAGLIGTLAIFVPFLFALAAFLELELVPSLVSPSYQWLSIGSLNIKFMLKIDHLSAIMVLIVTGVASLIHLYSIGYMGKDEGVARFFSYLNLFCFSMLLLVMASSLPILFFGWEGVGLCSYLLIGFWYTDKQKTDDGMKAFIMNRVGDFAFLMGMFLLYTQLGTLEFSDIIISLKNNPAAISPLITTVICLLLFFGATGKSAQLPLHTWLPDAMSGPTPVSALIHAATMVTAGVYMVVRLSPLFSLSSTAMTVIASVGAITALFAATIAIAQNDIKKVLAYSTVSQLGFMFLAAGVGAYSSAIFHLFTHAFFKALLFLCAGSVIHACSGEQDMRLLGGLKKYLPHTFFTMLIGSLALSGLPIFCGFFSKDEILFSTLALPQGAAWYYLVATLTSILTAIYTGRLLALTFFGEERMSHEVKEHLHESPPVMLIPLYILTILTTIGGLFGMPHIFGNARHLFAEWLSPSLLIQKLPELGIHLPFDEWGVILLATSFAALGLFIGLHFFTKHQNIHEAFRLPKFILKLLENKYYIDEFYDFIFVRPFQFKSRIIATFIDIKLVDGLVRGIVVASKSLSSLLRPLQNGDVQLYLLTIIVALPIFLLAALNMME